MVDGKDLLKLSDLELDDYRCTRVGFVWQQTTRNLILYLTAFENVELPIRLTRRSQLEWQVRIGELLEMIGLAKLMMHLPGQISGGEQQRGLIAVALVNQPAPFLADESTGELDTQTTRQILRLFCFLVDRGGTTFLVVSHDSFIDEYSDLVYNLQDGKILTCENKLDSPITDRTFTNFC